jgi:hypothetical protein
MTPITDLRGVGLSRFSKRTGQRNLGGASETWEVSIRQPEHQLGKGGQTPVSASLVSIRRASVHGSGRLLLFDSEASLEAREIDARLSPVSGGRVRPTRKKGNGRARLARLLGFNDQRAALSRDETPGTQTEKVSQQKKIDLSGACSRPARCLLVGVRVGLSPLVTKPLQLYNSDLGVPQVDCIRAQDSC